MRKIFLDIGGWNGASAIFFRKYHPEGKDFEIFTFECDRKNIQTIKSKNLPITLIEKGAWSYTGTKIFYYSGSHTQAGGTMYPRKTTGGIKPSNNYVVGVIDIAQFIRANFYREDHIIMKLNAEGAEYEIIPHLKRNNLIDWINKWYVQWHWEKIKMSLKDHKKVEEMIPTSCDWDCQCNEESFKHKFLNSL
jgi:FkbM family methyltransferase